MSAVSQTYVDELKKAGSFDAEAQKQALAMALAACIKAISPATKAFIEETYGDLTEYLTTYIEAEVRKPEGAARRYCGTGKRQLCECYIGCRQHCCCDRSRRCAERNRAVFREVTGKALPLTQR